MSSRIFPQASSAVAVNAVATDAEAGGAEGAPPRFAPSAPSSIEEAGLTEAMVESLIFKTMLASGAITSRNLARALALPGKEVVRVLNHMKAQQLLFYRDSAAVGDFEYELTDGGRLRARLYREECAYLGTAPVPLDAYIASVSAQGITTVHPEREDLERAFGDLLINNQMFERLGPAINSGRGLFLYGFPGNGKTSIAERITDCFGDDVWIPRALVAGGDIITLFDPEVHVPADQRVDTVESGKVDRRWVKIRRPTIVVGGELTMDALDLRHNERSNISEASLQLKSNTGTLVIDDFGRQRMSTIELLNRWIVPLEKRYDFLGLSGGRKIKVPFDQLIIFSTNLQPKDLVDEAFLRRIPYKINVIDPSEDEFRKLFGILSPHLGVAITDGAVDYLVEHHYRAVQRPFRCCQPRDLLLQIRSRAAYEGITPVATPETFDMACENYFAVV